MAGIQSIQALPQPSYLVRSHRKSLMRHAEDIRCIISTVLFFAVFLITWQTFTSPFTGGLLSFIAWLSLFKLSFMGAVTTHNAIHLPIFWDRNWNKFYQICLSLQYGGAVSIFVPGHNLSHHKYPQQARDVSKCFASVIFRLPRLAESTVMYCS
jgi:fatty acid desaturase